MTIDEAIQILEQQFDKSCGNYRYQNPQKLDYEDALWMAISALRAQQEQEKNEPLTNADRIRGMDDEELAKFLIKVHQGLLVENGVLNVKYWLQQPAEEGATCA